MGFLINSQRDNSGRNRSIYWASTDAGRLLKVQNGTQIDQQTHDLEAMMRVFEIKEREDDRELTSFMQLIAKRSNEQKNCWRRRVLREIFNKDASKSLHYALCITLCPYLHIRQSFQA